jgi:hypothetical protein
MKRRPRLKLSPACLRKAQRLAESLWWISAQHAPSRPGEPPEPWYSRLISHRLASERFNVNTSRRAIRWTRQQVTKRRSMKLHPSRYRRQVYVTKTGFFCARTWLTPSQMRELFPRKD